MYSMFCALCHVETGAVRHYANGTVRGEWLCEAHGVFQGGQYVARTFGRTVISIHVTGRPARASF
jgi:hypothetical protein